MKKDDSIYHVFDALPAFVKDHRILAGEEEAAQDAPAPPPPVKDDADVFLDAMKDVKKVDHGKERLEPKAEHGTQGAAAAVTETRLMDETLKEGRPFNVVNLPEYMEGFVEGVSPLVMEKLRSGEFSVQKVLDLHGLSAHDAYEAFQVFMEEAVHSGIRCIKVIHGRGLKSRGGPVLKEKLKGWIVRAMHRKWVVAFASSKMSAGGPGATTILLRTRADKKRLHIIG
jgi:DNA-nicking Smr family endonuclease